MTTSNSEDKISRIYSKLFSLTVSQLDWIEAVIHQFSQESKFSLVDSDIFTEDMAKEFGDILRIHHCFSKEPFTKDKFEHALERIANLNGISSALAPRGNPGHDITISGKRFSLKTQGDKSIKDDYLHISKFMELGKGKWVDESDLLGLLNQYLLHVENYERILSLRRLKSKSKNVWHYELVEIPRSLLMEARNGSLEMRHQSKQNPKPGYCFVKNDRGENKFQLYFDGGTERKLQIKQLKKALCRIHADWVFNVLPFNHIAE